MLNRSTPIRVHRGVRDQAPTRATSLGDVPEDGEHLSDELAGDAGNFLLPVGGGALSKWLWRPVREEWERNASKALRAAENASGMTREDLAELVENDPRAMPLYLQILWAAGMNGHDKTLRAMGAVFGHAADASARNDDEGFEDAELALRAMAGLGRRHFRVLSVLGESSVHSTEAGSAVYNEFMPEYVSARSRLREEIAHQCLLNLAAAGLTTSVSVFDGTAYPITELGRAVLLAVRAVSDEPNGE